MKFEFSKATTQSLLKAVTLINKKETGWGMIQLVKPLPYKYEDLSLILRHCVVGQ